MANHDNKDRILYVDSYRGIAALGVAWFHIYTSIKDPSVSGQLSKASQALTAEVVLNYLAVWGRWGVRLFFVISGFVLAFSLQRKYSITSLAATGRYLIRRSIRLDPAYWFALLLTLGLLAIAGQQSYIHEHARKISTVGEFLSNAFYVNGFIGHIPVISVSWTLVIEIQLYIIFAFLLYFASLLTRYASIARENAAFIIIMLFAALSLLWHFVPFFALPADILTSYFFIFMIGVLVYNSFLEKRYLPMLLLYAGVLVYFYFKQHDTSLMVVVLCAALLYATQYITLLRGALENRCLLYFGKLSYCIYLLHIPVGLVSATLFVQLFTNIFPYSLAVHFLAAVFSIGTTVAASHYVNRFIEEKSIRLSKKIRIS